MDNNWHNKVLLSHKKEIESSAIFFAGFLLVLLLWQYLTGQHFVWQNISIISEPSVFDLLFYKAFAFVTVGAFLYYIVKLWKILKFICIDLLGSPGLYYEVKRIVWAIILLITFYTTPKLFDLLNAMLSFLYNILNLTLYLFPPLGISLIIFIILLLYKQNRRGSIIESKP